MKRRRKLVIAVSVVSLLIIAPIVIISYQNRPRPVEYPADWPLDFVRAPEGAWDGPTAPTNKIFGIFKDSIDDQFPKEKSRTSTVGRIGAYSWQIGFRFKGSAEDVVAEFEDELRDRGWLKDPYTETYFSPDYYWCIRLLDWTAPMPKHSFVSYDDKDLYGLIVMQYDQPVNHLPVPSKAVPLSDSD